MIYECTVRRFRQGCYPGYYQILVLNLCLREKVFTSNKFPPELHESGVTLHDSIYPRLF